MIEVLHAGMLTTVQDLGRHGYQRDGVIVSGAMDPSTLQSGNLLVGNDAGEGALALTLVSPTLQFSDAAVITVTGQGMVP